MKNKNIILIIIAFVLIVLITSVVIILINSNSNKNKVEAEQQSLNISGLENQISKIKSFAPYQNIPGKVTEKIGNKIKFSFTFSDPNSTTGGIKEEFAEIDINANDFILINSYVSDESGIKVLSRKTATVDDIKVGDEILIKTFENKGREINITRK